MSMPTKDTLNTSFRPYGAADREVCLSLLDANTPEFFGVNERPDFEEFLDDIPGAYLVLLDGDRVIGCGGYRIEDDSEPDYDASVRVARTTWGMVHPDYKGLGLGKLLFIHRREMIKASGEADRIRVLTSQYIAAFFTKLGFYEVRREKDVFADGIDLVELFFDF